jgi:glutathione peroxidase
MKMLNGSEKSLSDYKGKVILIVNVASKCGLTPQYKDLEAIYKKYKDQGFVILGFPANNFLWQEPGEDSEIASFCQINYGVTFDMFSKISVKGSDIHPLYQFLTQKKYNNLEDASIKWNFQKFLIDREGNMVKAINPKTKISDSSVIANIEALLK